MSGSGEPRSQLEALPDTCSNVPMLKTSRRLLLESAAVLAAPAIARADTWLAMQHLSEALADRLGLKPE